MMLAPGHGPYIIEPRHPDGTLNVQAIGTPDGPPGGEFDVNGLAQLYYQHNPGEGNADWEDIYAWYKGRGWVFRRKTW